MVHPMRRRFLALLEMTRDVLNDIYIIAKVKGENGKVAFTSDLSAYR